MTKTRTYSTAPDPTGMKYAQNRKQRRAASAGKTVPITRLHGHRQHQQGDEIACSCGRRRPCRWSHGKPA